MLPRRGHPSPGLCRLAWGTLAMVGCAQQQPALIVPRSPLVDTQKLCQRLQAKLPKGWKIVEVTESDAPRGWHRSSGESGLRIHMTNPEATVTHPILGPYHPTFTIWLMPLAWEGAEPLKNQHVRSGKFTQGPFKPDPDPDTFPAAYWGTTPPFHYFYTNVGMGPWRKAPVITAKVLAVARWTPTPAPADTRPAERPPAGADRAGPTDTVAPEQAPEP